MKNQKGFTLVELLVVITIIAVLATIGMTSYRSATAKARDARRDAEIQQLRSALEAYRTVEGTYPNSGACRSDNAGCWTPLMTTLDDYLSGPAIQDPKNEDGLVYTYTATDFTYTITFRKELETTVTQYEQP